MFYFFYLVEWGLIPKKGEYFCSREECKKLENLIPLKLNKHNKDMWCWSCRNYVSINKKRKLCDNDTWEFSTMHFQQKM